ncbi:MAG TPA: hypothetical protein VKY85_26765 [Candidatus Angelobacter sp.]|nr:hypothetical protein [Candidatus Angelobacter sp.]
MTLYSTRQAARKLGITQAGLSQYLKAKKIPAPKMITSGRLTLHLWTEEEVERVRQLLPKIKNGRKTRQQKKQGTKTKPTTKQPQPRPAVPHKKKTGSARC